MSVIMAAYNEERHVGQAIASVLGQTLSDLELLIVDDASTDRTAHVLGTFAKADSRVQVLSSAHNLGRADARNWALRESRADLIAILDADDVMLPQRLLKQIEFMVQRPAVGMLGAEAYYLLPDNGAMKLVRTPTRDDEIRRKLRQGIMPFVHSSMVFRRDLLLSCGGYARVTPSFGEDYHLCVGMIEATEAAALPEPLVIVSCEGLLQAGKLKAKHAEMADMEYVLLRKRFSPGRLASYLARRLGVLLLPPRLELLLMRARLRHLPDCSPAERKVVNAWLQAVALRRDEIVSRD